MSTTVEYKIFCVDEGEVITGLTYPPVEAVCPRNPTHAVEETTLTIIKTNEINTVKVEEDNIETGGNFRIKGWQMDIPEGAPTHQMDIKFDVPISVRSIGYLANADLVGDFINGYIIPNNEQDGLIAALTLPVTAGSNKIYISAGSIIYIKKLYQITLNDGAVVENIGEVEDVNLSEASITLKNPIVNNFAAGTGVFLRIQTIEQYYLHDQNMPPIGESSLRGSALPAKTTARLIYTNTNGAAKSFKFFAEIRY